MLIADIYRYTDAYYEFLAKTQSGNKEAMERREEYRKISAPWIEKYAKLGKWKAHYPFADGRGGISIWEFESGEEMASVLSDSIVFPYIQSETIILSEVDMIANVLK